MGGRRTIAGDLYHGQPIAGVAMRKGPLGWSLPASHMRRRFLGQREEEESDLAVVEAVPTGHRQLWAKEKGVGEVIIKVSIGSQFLPSPLPATFSSFPLLLLRLQGSCVGSGDCYLLLCCWQYSLRTVLSHLSRRKGTEHLCFPPASDCSPLTCCCCCCSPPYRLPVFLLLQDLHNRCPVTLSCPPTFGCVVTAAALIPPIPSPLPPQSV